MAAPEQVVIELPDWQGFRQHLQQVAFELDFRPRPPEQPAAEVHSRRWKKVVAVCASRPWKKVVAVCAVVLMLGLLIYKLATNTALAQDTGEQKSVGQHEGLVQDTRDKEQESVGQHEGLVQDTRDKEQESVSQHEGLVQDTRDKEEESVSQHEESKGPSPKGCSDEETQANSELHVTEFLDAVDAMNGHLSLLRVDQTSLDRLKQKSKAWLARCYEGHVQSDDDIGWSLSKYFETVVKQAMEKCGGGEDTVQITAPKATHCSELKQGLFQELFKGGGDIPDFETKFVDMIKQEMGEACRLFDENQHCMRANIDLMVRMGLFR